MTTAANRRDGERRPRRLRVRFREIGETRAYLGFTTNLSVTGAYISTHHPVGRGCRLRVEVTHDEASCVLEAMVAHAHRVPPALRKIATPGMGVRFLSREELLEPLMPARSPAAAPVASPVATGDPVGGAPTYPVRFESLSEFHQVYRRDLVNGGLFVMTSRPSRLDERVVLELFIPTEEGFRLSVPGKVVQVVEPRATPTGKSGGGMGIQLTEVGSLVATLEPLAASLDGFRESVQGSD